MPFKRSIVFIVFACISFTCYSQTIVRLGNLRLTQDFGAIYNNSIGVDIGYTMKDLDERSNSYLTFGLYRSAPEKEVYISYAYDGFGYDPILERSSNVYSDLYLGQVTLGWSYNFLEKKISPMVSLDGIFYFGTYKVGSSGLGIENASREGIQGGGLMPSAGISYLHSKDLLFQFKVGKMFPAPYRSQKIRYWNIGLTSIFNF